LAAALAFCALTAAPALAHGRVGFGFYFGGPMWYPAPYYYPPPVYYYPPPVVVQSPQYIERPAAAAPAPQASAPQSGAEPSSGDWYFCRDSQTYYPYVKECASPWQRVPSRPGS
jgi:hypothetical protein